MVGVSAPRHRLLVVEDEEAVAEGLRLLLEQEYTVHLAASGQQALDKITRDGPFDAVLCDLEPLRRTELTTLRRDQLIEPTEGFHCHSL